MNQVFLKRASLNQLTKDSRLILDILKEADLASHLKKNDLVGIKTHFGEKGNKSHIGPHLLAPLVKYLKKLGTKPFLFDTNTLYRGQRTNSIDHIDLAILHGFGKLGIPIIIGDGVKGNDYFEVEIAKKHFLTCFIASVVKDLDFMLVISHFTGHMLTGFGASLKNVGMGCASRRGKLAQHCDCAPEINPQKCSQCGTCKVICPAQCISEINGAYSIDSNTCIGCAQCISACPVGAVKIIWSEAYDVIQEKMVEYAYAVTRGIRCAYFNFCVYITKDCDCINKEDKGFVGDLGILFGFDPVAVDKASIELIIEQEKDDFLKRVYPQINYSHQLEYAQSIGLGSLDYKLIEL
jgi:hypothetical protein